MNFADRLDEAVQRAGNPCLVGLDPHPDLLPEEYSVARDANAPIKARARAVGDFCEAVLELVAGRVPAVKPQSALFEPFGADGVETWERVITGAREKGLLVIGDVKRGDIGSSAAAYAEAYLGNHDRACDAITVNPYLGSDAVKPFVEICHRTSHGDGKGLYVLVRTSNPDSAMFQLHGTPPLVDTVARAVDAWGSELVGSCGLSSIGAVVGATHPDELARLRSLMPHTPFLLPGYGAQGAGAADVVPAFLSGPTPAPRGALVNSSRGLLFAYRDPKYTGLDWKHATNAALDDMIQSIGSALR